MKISLATTAFSTRTTRVMAFVLLVGIIYGVTFSSAHSHGATSSKAGANITTGVPVLADSSFLVPIQSPSHRQECLICLFHQQLFSSVVHPPLYIVKPSIRVKSISPQRVAFYSISFTSTPIGRLSGRAPPIC